MSILSWIVVGLIAGWLAGKVMGSGYGLIGDIIIGVVGGLLGGWIATSLLHIGAEVSGLIWNQSWLHLVGQWYYFSCFA